MVSLDEILKNVYYDPTHPASFGSVQKLYLAIRDRYPNVSINQIKEWLSAQDTYTLHRAVKRKFHHAPIYSPHVDHTWQMDLADVKHLAKKNDSIKFLFIIIDVLSRFAFVIPLKSKNSRQIVAAFKFIEENYNRKPHIVVSDPGLEFRGEFTDYLRKKNIIQFLLRPEQKAAIAERFIRTLKEKMQKGMTYSQTKRYIDDLGDYVSSYNNAIHSRLKEKPINVNSSIEDIIRRRLYGNRENYIPPIPKYNVGDQVRVVKNVKLFEKGTTEGTTTDEVFIIDRIELSIPPKVLYKLVDIEGDYIRGLFYQEQLVPVRKEDDPRVYMHTGKKRVKKTKRKTQIFKTYKGWRRKFDKLINVAPK